MTVTAETAPAGDVAEPGGAPAPAAAERQCVDAARQLVEAEDLADAVAKEITPENTVDTYNKSWRVWTRFCAVTELPEEVLP
ncbi:hypothetical protein [Streptomyces sp. NPDC053720]|uniref:hypothetical protein n=1 Tax=Streptomyces sp. NPDC053720 TaxID=3154855 RepID=UPI003444A547